MMSNVEYLSSNVEWNPNDQEIVEPDRRPIADAMKQATRPFELRHSDFIRRSDLGIRHSHYGI